MIWNSLMSGEVFSNWIKSLVPDPTTSSNANFKKGQTLDPFETSLRVTKRYTDHLTNVENGVDIARQNNIDLVKACILDKTDTGYVISQLGDSVLHKWRELSIDNDSDGDEFYRVFILILEANKLNITKYVDMLSFWKEIKGTGDPIQLINNPSSLYLMGVLNQNIDDFNPWVLIQKNHLQFDPIGTINQLKAAYQNELEVISRLVRIESIWQNDFRPKGRQVFCLAMDCVLSEVDDVISLINAQNMNHFMGDFSEQNVRTSFETYSLLKVGQNTTLIGDNRIF